MSTNGHSSPGVADGTSARPIDIGSYAVTDAFFGAPYIDVDEERSEPLPHRHIHGGFDGTQTRFRIYFPSADLYQGRMITPLFGGHGGTEDFFGSPLGVLAGVWITGVWGTLPTWFDKRLSATASRRISICCRMT